MTKTHNNLCDILREFDSASNEFKAFKTAHEGYAVLKEEMDELWDEVKKNPTKRDLLRMRAEAIQVGAMALRFLEDCCK